MLIFLVVIAALVLLRRLFQWCRHPVRYSTRPVQMRLLLGLIQWCLWVACLSCVIWYIQLNVWTWIGREVVVSDSVQSSDVEETQQ